MIVTKLFQTSKKQLQPKPQRIKIKHKTYRQLLGLDRPKKKIQIQSDNENDDFLEKLLKQQAKEKKKKKTESKRGQSKSRESKSRKNIKGGQSEQLKKQQNVTKKQKKSEQKEIKKESMNISKQSNRKVININKNNDKSQKKPEKPSQSPQIKIDQQNSVPYVVNNSLLTNIKNIRSSQAFNTLKQKMRKTVYPSLNSFKMQPNLNPQKQQVLHRFSQTTNFNNFKAKQLTTKQLMTMSEIKVNVNRQNRVHRRQKLFAGQQQQDRFVRSLKQIKVKKYSMPSLL